MNKLITILTIIFNMMAYCAAMRNCNITNTNAELYTTAINVRCSDELNRFTNISSGLVNHLANINGGNFKLKSQVKVYNTYNYICISSYMCILLLHMYRQMLLIIIAP